MAGDPRLSLYRSRRDFGRTPEPASGKPRRAGGRIFVIQQHDATRLHFDFRLEVDGILKSWAVPKGPSTDPQQRRLAVPTEDHPLDYADFEGVIPAGEYGGGTVIVWDAGSYRNDNRDRHGRFVSMNAALEAGKAIVTLEGKKLRGSYALIRTGGTGVKPQWLLIKRDDDFADARRNPVKTEPRSVLSGRTLAEVARDGAGQ